MKFILKLHPEISIKSDSVRRRFTKILESNVRNIFKPYEFKVAVWNKWDKLVMEARTETREQEAQVVDQLKRIPGIEQCLQVRQSEYQDLDDIYQQVKAVWHDKLAGKSFAVRVKRRGKHEFSSVDVARYVGGGLNQHCDTGGVNLTKPDVIVELEIDKEHLLIIDDRFKCLGGMPLPTQEDVVSLISGGFDSGVASYQMIRRGARTHYCFFNLGGRQHEIGVKQVACYLWKQYSASHRVKFIGVDFEPVVAQILERVDNGLMGVVLKRMMLRAASIVADNLDISTLVTGEALGQVSSQTLSNLAVIDRATEKLVLRPLICWDKSDIINQARQIGTEDFAKSMPEYCGVISKKPTVRAILSEVEEQEAKLDADLIANVVRASHVLDIRRMAQEAEQEVPQIDASDALPSGAVVLDIRSPEEEEDSPLTVEGHEVKTLPFFRLASQFGDLDQNQEYYLYCARGVMSRMQALLLHEQGYQNVKVYRPLSR
ncbi:tRNA 4-thiouridine(8) synthase ThiI [Bowmanella sp. Y26]|uniref:tRNA uracil 4-sulfurtransferase ThiI n=1 Tax=Bowmanella yangjiangensis TaxID=2811230 RepID=UPI001BDCBDBA|nr:tRNA uracil 4-sulfurtransferase ThiI [Bowmanella yangjiangensis]MBT1062954.1 tRNA 4-thiouridine(8) synthase ThiI [Bowmanella yangjiangensis]